LTLTTMLFADEVRPRKGIDAATQKSHKPMRAGLDAAVAVIEELSCEWEPAKHKDRYRKRLLDVVAQKRKGKTIKAPKAPEEPSEAPDLMAALERTLEELKSESPGRRPRQEAAR
jgi:DNA end-binding protein Ku